MTTSTTTSEPTRVNGRRITLLVALAVFAQESTWNLYESQVPPLLREHLTSAAVVGFLMGLDNLLGIFVHPLIGNRSDRTRTSWGRRMPYILVGMPVAAALFVLIPHSAGSLPLLVLVMVAYALVANMFKPLAESLVPDFVAPERRSRANAAVKIASAVTVIVAALISVFVIDEHPAAAFAIPAGLMLVAAGILALTVRDSRSPAYRAAVAEDLSETAAPREKLRVRVALGEIVRDEDRSRLLLIGGILLFGCAWASSRTLMTPYGQEALDLSRGDAGGLTLPSGVAFLLAAYPVALASERIGRLRMMKIGMSVFALAVLAAAALQTPTGTVVAMCVAAAGGTAFLINAVVVLWNLAPTPRLLGTYTGFYTVGWAGGGFLGPGVVGGAVDLTNWSLMLVHVAVLAAAATFVIARVDRLQRRSPVTT